MGAELVDLGDQSLLDMPGILADQHGIAQNSRQGFEAFVPIGRIGRRSGRDGITFDRGQIELVGVIPRGAHASSSEPSSSQPVALEVGMRRMSSGSAGGPSL